MEESVKGTKELIAALNKLERKIANTILRTELKAGAKEIAAAIKPLVPQGETGMLERAVKVKSAKRKKGTIGFVAQIGEGSFKGETFYGGFVDLGTENQPAQQFMEKGFQSKCDQLANELPDRIGRAIEDAAQQGAK